MPGKSHYVYHSVLINDTGILPKEPGQKYNEFKKEYDYYSNLRGYTSDFGSYDKNVYLFQVLNEQETINNDIRRDERKSEEKIKVP